jgi:hypothetical protein|tara:strand:+ start:5771 stop:6181 length:411 start_codon:yes stop_codon:yes gene_type:complete
MKMKKKGYAAGGALKKPTAKQAGVKKLPKDVRNKMGYMKDGGKVKKKGYAKGGMMKKKGYALGGATTPMEGEQSRYRPSANRAPQGMMSARGMSSGMGMAKGGMMKKKGYAKGGKVMTYNLGGMVKEQRDNRKKKK